MKIKERRNSLGVAPLKLCKLLFIVCMLFEYMGVEICPAIPFHASDGALVAFEFLFVFIFKSPVQVSQYLEVFGRELLLE